MRPHVSGEGVSGEGVAGEGVCGEGGVGEAALVDEFAPSTAPCSAPSGISRILKGHKFTSALCIRSQAA